MSTTRAMIRYQPTYRLTPKKPYKKDECEELIKAIVDTTMATFVYEPDEAVSLCQSLSEEILSKVKSLNFDRYKLVCVVTIGEKYMQSFCDIFKCLWDMQKDGYAFYVHDTPTVFTIAVLYAVYCN